MQRRISTATAACARTMAGMVTWADSGGRFAHALKEAVWAGPAKRMDRPARNADAAWAAQMADMDQTASYQRRRSPRVGSNMLPLWEAGWQSLRISNGSHF